MKFKNIILGIILIICLTSCSVGSDNNIRQVVRIDWHLKNVSGGVEGINDNFDFNVVIWTFNESQHSLKVENNNTDTSKEDGLDSGTYTYSLLQAGNASYLIIDNNEIGSLTFSNNQLIINQNETSTGSGADGFIYTFQKVEITE